MMRVAHFIQRYPPALGGSEAYFARLSRFLAKRGERVNVFTTTALDLEAFWSPGGRQATGGTTTEDSVVVHRYPIAHWPGRGYLLKALSLVPHRTWQCLTIPCNPISPAMWRDSGQPVESFDVVHAAAFPYAWPIVCGLRLARRLHIPFGVTPFIHLGDPENPSDATRRAYLSPALLSLLRSADRVFVQTGLEKTALQQRGIPEAKLVLLGMGVDERECAGGNRRAARTEWRVADDDVVIGHLANLSEEKGTVDLLRAADLLWRRGDRFHLVLAGPEMPNFRRTWTSFPWRARTRRLGVLDEAMKRDFYAGLDLFALPSRSDSFGLVLLEAWSNALPNIAYRAGGVAEVIRHQEDGLLVRCGDVNGLAESLAELIRDPRLRRRLGERGADRVLTDFRWEDKLNRVRAVYQEMNGGPG
jgi:glycosyltransferase involved in cell wall biosynthesis